jgi:hypothetical protein
MDNDLIVLKHAKAALFAIDVKYKMSGFNTKKGSAIKVMKHYSNVQNTK